MSTPSLANHDIRQQTLSNGITLLMVPLPNTAAVTSIVLFGVGSRYESDAQQGLAHFTEHMVFKGGKKYPSTQAISRALDGVGGEFNAYTSQEFTGFYTKTAAPHLKLGLDVLSDMVLHATFPEEELRKEKGVIVEEINMYEDMPMRKVDQVLGELVYGDTPAGRPVIGTKQSVTAFTAEDFKQYRDQFYYGKQCVIVVVGAFDPEQLPAIVEAKFKGMPEGKPYQPEPAVFQTNRRVELEEKKSEQTHFMLAVRALPLGHPKRYILRVLATILGGNMSSRLFYHVREQHGLCYYVKAYADCFTDDGLLVASAGVDNSRLPLALEAVIEQFRSMRDEAVGEEELNRAKQFLVGKLLLSTEDSESVAELYGMQLLLEKKINSLEEMRQGVEEVTAEQVQALAQELMKDDLLRLAVIGPHTDAAKLEGLLHF